MQNQYIVDRRKEMRFPVSLRCAAREGEKDSTIGLIKDFSRDGLRAIFDNFRTQPDSYVNLKIQKPNQDIFFPARAEVRWKRPVEGRWEVGLRFRDFVPQVKAEILEHAYNIWLKDNVYALPGL